jgi:hypothetical protein
MSGWSSARIFWRCVELPKAHNSAWGDQSSLISHRRMLLSLFRSCWSNCLPAGSPQVSVVPLLTKEHPKGHQWT